MKFAQGVRVAVALLAASGACDDGAGHPDNDGGPLPDAAPIDPFLPADRLPPPGTWEAAGVEGGIPARATICAVVTDAPYNADPTGATSAVAAIQAAIDACPPGEVVSVPAGSFRIDAALQLQRGVTLRGGGAAATTFRVSTGTGVSIGRLGPWPPPKANDGYRAPITGGASRGSTTVQVGDASAVEVGKMIMVDEEDDPAIVWTKQDNPGRYRASMHLVEAKTATSVTFRPPLAMDFARSPQLSWFPDLVEGAGVEAIRFEAVGDNPTQFIEIASAWNVWVAACEFTGMPRKTIVVAWSGHVELRRNYLHDQANGGSNSEALDLLGDVNWSLVIDNIAVAAGYPQINIGDAGANPYYSGGFGNVIAYNYAVDAYFTDPPTAADAGKMPHDLSTNHSPHTMYTLVEGNVAGKFGADAYHGSASHQVLLRNWFSGTSRWTGVSNPLAIQLDRRNTHHAIIGNVLGVASDPADLEYAETSNWNGRALYRLGFPDMGNEGYSGTSPPAALLHADGGPRDLYVDRDTTEFGTTIIEGNWTSTAGRQDFTIPPAPVPPSLFLPAKPAWFGALAWPPIDPTAPVTDDPTIIPAGYRYVHGVDP